MQIYALGPQQRNGRGNLPISQGNRVYGMYGIRAHTPDVSEQDADFPARDECKPAIFASQKGIHG